MLFDGIKLLSGSVAQNLNIKTGLTFPTGTEGELFYIKEGAAFTEGLYVYDGAAWNLTNNVLTALEISTALGYTPLSGNQTITTSGDVTGSGTTAITLTLANTPVAAGTYKSVQVDTKGRVVAGANPTTLAGYGITDAISANGVVSSIGALSTSTTGLVKLTNGIASLDTNTYLTDNQTVSVSGDATGSGATSITLTLVNTPVTPGTYKSVQVDSKGRVVAGANPTTLAGYGITDAYTKAATDLAFQPLDADLTAIAAISTTSGLLKKTAADTWSLDTNTYLTGNQTVSVSGDATGSGTTAIALTLAASGVTAGTYNTVTVDAKGRATSGGNAAYLLANQTVSVSGDAIGSGATSIALTLVNTTVSAGSYGSATSAPTFTVDEKGRLTAASSIVITPAFSSITGKPTTLAGYGITDAIGANGVVSSIGSLSTSTTGLVKLTNGVASFDSSIYLTGNQAVSVTGDATGSGATSIALTLAASGVTAGSYGSATSAPTFTVDEKGRVTAAGTATITPAFSSITGKPTTLAGYGVSDAVNKTGDTMSGNLVISTGAKLTLADAPLIGTDAVNKNYVDAAIAGLSWKNGVKALATTNITLSGAQTVDGISLVAGDRVLVSGQTDAKTNGIYIVASGAWTRSLDADTGIELVGLGVWVNGGTVYADTGWTCTNDTVALGTDSIFFVQFNGASGITAGIGLTKTGNTLSVGLGAGIAQLPSTEVGVDVYVGGGLMLTTDGSVSSTISAAQLALTNTGVAAGSYNNVTVDAKGRVTAASTVAYITGNQLTTVTGDATGSGTTAIALTLANSGVTAGSYNNVTVDAKGRVTAGSTVAYITGNQTITASGDVTGSGTTAIALTLANTSVTAGSYGSATAASTFTVDTKGRLTAAGSVTITPAFSSLTGKPTTLSGYGISDAMATGTVIDGGAY